VQSRQRVPPSTPPHPAKRHRLRKGSKKAESDEGGSEKGDTEGEGGEEEGGQEEEGDEWEIPEGVEFVEEPDPLDLAEALLRRKRRAEKMPRGRARAGGSCQGSQEGGGSLASQEGEGCGGSGQGSQGSVGGSSVVGVRELGEMVGDGFRGVASPERKRRRAIVTSDDED